MKKQLQTLIAFTFFVLSASAQNINFPDDNFKAALLSNDSINTDADKLEISTSEAAAYKGTINLDKKGIELLDGIENFINITGLSCYYNQVTSLDVSKNIKLKTLECSRNQLSVLDVSKNVGLVELKCKSNQLTGLDLSTNLALITLWCHGNQLTTLNIIKNVALHDLNAENNKLTSLDFSGNPALESIYIYKNMLVSLDLSSNPALTFLQCYENNLTAINVSKNLALRLFECHNNSLSTLDVSKNTSLQSLKCNNNQLTCICALDKQNKGLWTKDGSAVYSENCTAGIEDEIIKRPKTLAHIYNINGQEVSKYYTGLVIYLYTDGSTEKVIQE